RSRMPRITRDSCSGRLPWFPGSFVVKIPSVYASCSQTLFGLQKSQPLPGYAKPCQPVPGPLEGGGAPDGILPPLPLGLSREEGLAHRLARRSVRNPGQTQSKQVKAGQGTRGYRTSQILQGFREKRIVYFSGSVPLCGIPGCRVRRPAECIRPIVWPDAKRDHVERPSFRTHSPNAVQNSSTQINPACPNFKPISGLSNRNMNLTIDLGCDETMVRRLTRPACFVRQSPSSR